jgi:hypothetical protein
MRRTIPKILRRRVIVPIVPFVLQLGAARAQTPQKGCTGIDVVAAVPWHPFIADYVRADANPFTMRETVARDSKGRIRIGAHTNLTPQGVERMKKFDVGRREAGIPSVASGVGRQYF